MVTIIAVKKMMRTMMMKLVLVCGGGGAGAEDGSGPVGVLVLVLVHIATVGAIVNARGDIIKSILPMRDSITDH